MYKQILILAMAIFLGMNTAAYAASITATSEVPVERQTLAFESAGFQAMCERMTGADLFENMTEYFRDHPEMGTRMMRSASCSENVWIDFEHEVKLDPEKRYRVDLGEDEKGELLVFITRNF